MDAHCKLSTICRICVRADLLTRLPLPLCRVRPTACSQVKNGKKAHGPWKPLAADKLFHFKGVHFKGFTKRKAAMLHKLKQQAKMQMKHTRFNPSANKPKQLWPSSVIAGSGPQAPAAQSARPVWQSDMPVSPMGTNGVFLGSHQGGDSSFSHGPQPQATAPRGSAQRRGAAPPPQPSPYMSVTHKADPHMLYQQQQKKKQLWPGSVIGQQPAKGHDTRPRPWITAADGSVVPGARRRHVQGLAFTNKMPNRAGAAGAPVQANKPDMSFAPKQDKYGRRTQWTMGADGSLVGAAGCVGSTC